MASPTSSPAVPSQRHASGGRLALSGKAALLLAALLPLAASLAQQQPAPQPLPAVKPATDGKVWGALIYATKSAEAAPLSKTVPRSLADLPQRLGKVFPFTRFEIIGEHTQDIFRQYESWVVPSKELFLKLDSQGPAEGGGISLNLQFWRQQQVLVKTDTVLRPDSPLFITGPKWREGQLVFVLLLTK